MMNVDKLRPQQQMVLESTHPFTFIYGGVGTGKTTALILKLYLHIQAFPKSKILVIANTWEQITEIFMSEWYNQVPESEFTYHQTKHIITMTHSKSKIQLFYTESKRAKERIKGRNISGFLFTEMDSINDEYFWLQAEDRMRLFGEEPNPAYIRLADCNPGNPGHWVHRYFIDKTSDVYLPLHEVLRIKVRTTPETSSYSAETIEKARRINPAWRFQRMYEGEWTSAEGRVWEKYTTFPHPAGNMVDYASKYDRIALGGDYGWEHPLCIVFAGYKAGVWEIFDEIYVTKTDIESVIEMVESRLKEWGLEKRHLNIYVDPSAKGWVGEWNLRKTQIYAYQAHHKGTDPVLNRAVKINEMFRSERLIVSTLCKNVIKDCEMTIYKKDSIQDEIDKKYYDPHAMDAVGYFVTQEVL